MGKDQACTAALQEKEKACAAALQENDQAYALILQEKDRVHEIELREKDRAYRLEMGQEHAVILQKANADHTAILQQQAEIIAKQKDAEYAAALEAKDTAMQQTLAFHRAALDSLIKEHELQMQKKAAEFTAKLQGMDTAIKENEKLSKSQLQRWLDLTQMTMIADSSVESNFPFPLIIFDKNAVQKRIVKIGCGANVDKASFQFAIAPDGCEV